MIRMHHLEWRRVRKKLFGAHFISHLEMWADEYGTWVLLSRNIGDFTDTRTHNTHSVHVQRETNRIIRFYMNPLGTTTNEYFDPAADVCGINEQRTTTSIWPYYSIGMSHFENIFCQQSIISMISICFGRSKARNSNFNLLMNWNCFIHIYFFHAFQILVDFIYSQKKYGDITRHKFNTLGTSSAVKESHHRFKLANGAELRAGTIITFTHFPLGHEQNILQNSYETWH